MSIRKRSADGTTVDQITATRGSSVESNGELSASDSFPQTSWTAWTRSTHDIFGRVVSTRVYHNIPMSGEGLPGANFHETLYAYDEMGRQNRTQTPDGTIRRAVFSAFGETISSWIGTDDTGATGSDPGGNGAFGNDMVMLSSNEFDNNQPGLDRLLTKTILRNDAQVVAGASSRSSSDVAGASRHSISSTSDRITVFQYDWRNRQIASITEGPAFNHISRKTLDNLDRPSVSESLSDDGTGEILVSRSQTLFDDRGRTYRSLSLIHISEPTRPY